MADIDDLLNELKRLTTTANETATSLQKVKNIGTLGDRGLDTTVTQLNLPKVGQPTVLMPNPFKPGLDKTTASDLKITSLEKKTEKSPAHGTGEMIVNPKVYAKFGVEGLNLAAAIAAGESQEGIIGAAGQFLRGTSHVGAFGKLAGVAGVGAVGTLSVLRGIKAAEEFQKGNFGEGFTQILDTSMNIAYAHHVLKEVAGEVSKVGAVASATKKSAILIHEISMVERAAAAGLKVGPIVGTELGLAAKLWKAANTAVDVGSITGIVAKLAGAGIAGASAAVLVPTAIYMAGRTIYDIASNKIGERSDEEKKDIVRNIDAFTHSAQKYGGHTILKASDIYEPAIDQWVRSYPTLAPMLKNSPLFQILGIDNHKVPRADMEEKYKKADELMDKAYANIGAGKFGMANNELNEAYRLKGQNPQHEPTSWHIWYVMETKRVADRNFTRWNMARLGSRAGD